MTSEIDVRVAFSDTYFDSVTKLQPNIQAKANQLVMKFQANPRSSGLNFERINSAKDENMRSLRIDQAYRIILLAPEEGNVYLFLWADHHDDAYNWATNHKCRVNPNTGSVQLYSTKTIEKDDSQAQTEAVETLFKDLRDRQLLKLGVPEEQLEIVKTVMSEYELDKLQSVIPREAYEALFYYIAGESYENILLEREVKEEQQFDTSNFAAALERYESLSRFVVPEDDVALSEMLNASMEKWRVFLHPSQRKLSTGIKNGAVRVLGGAGTGKTVVAMHRAKWLARHNATPEKRVLFTTFTKNLAVDIGRNLESICTDDEMGLMEIINLDNWVQRFLRKHSYDFQVIYDNKKLDELWGRALSEKPANLDFPDAFFKEEWQRVIQPQGIKSQTEYFKATRVGRGTRLNRMQRAEIWPVFEEYRYQLNKARFKEVDDAYRDAAELIQGQNISLPYSSIIVDEAQDMGTQAFKLLRAIVPEGKNDLFIVGDAHQRIYGRNKVVLGQCGINIRGRARKLKINYRTTDEIRTWSTALLEGRDIDDLDGGKDNNKLYKSLTHGQAPIIENFSDAKEQAGFIKSLLETTGEKPEYTCVIARTNPEVATIEQQLNEIGVATAVIKPNEADVIKPGVLNLATVHRVKGLEFDTVILASANKGLFPLSIALRDKADPVSLEEADTEERSLVYVAMTRARKNAFVLSYGEISEYFI